MDRSIPHVRDIFAPYRSTPETTHDKNKIHVYEHSPGSRRRRYDTKDDLPPQDFIDTDHSDSTDEGPVNNNREQQIRTRDKSRHSNNNNHSNANRNSYHDLLCERNDMNSKSGYSSKTLTERDIRHLERHLSMKKTIRKQISRNLAQAFVDDTVVFEGDSSTPVIVQKPEPVQPTTKPQPLNNSTFTLTRAKIAARSEHTFLDMLKKDCNRGPSEADSGHSSPSHQGGFEDEAVMDVDYDPPQYTSYSGRQESHARHDQLQQQSFTNDQNKKPSFWKKLGFKGKAKR